MRTSKGTLTRVLTLLALSGLWLVFSASSAAADELDHYLIEADHADYSGRQVVVTVWDGVSRAGIFDVEQAGMMRRGAGESMVGAGKAVTDQSVAISEWSAPVVASRYSMGAPGERTRLGRQARTIDVFEDGALRARLVFDMETSAPLATEVFDGNGSLFRFSTMIDFSPGVKSIYASPASSSDYDMMLSVDGSSLPATVAGYVRADTYSGPDQAIHTFFTDGLFRFSLFEVEGVVEAGRFDSGSKFQVGQATYQRIVEPSEIWVHWRSGETSYVLVGDLPPDHLEEVLVELPHPRNRGFFKRIWRGLFG